MMTRYKLIMSIALFTIILAVVISPSVVNSTDNHFIITQLNKNIEKALSSCGVNPLTTYISSSLSPVITNTTITFSLSLSNNYSVTITMRLANSQLPINEINITIITKEGHICGPKIIPISNTTGAYGYVVQRSEYFIEILSYSGSAPIITNGSKSLIAYGTKINSAIVIPTMVGNIICSTGSLSTPVYIIRVLNSPIMYVVQPSKPITSLLCRYSQTLSNSYLLMVILIGIAAAIIYEAVLLMVRISRLKIIQ